MHKRWKRSLRYNLRLLGAIGRVVHVLAPEISDFEAQGHDPPPPPPGQPPRLAAGCLRLAPQPAAAPLSQAEGPRSEATSQTRKVPRA